MTSEGLRTNDEMRELLGEKVEAKWEFILLPDDRLFHREQPGLWLEYAPARPGLES